MTPSIFFTIPFFNLALFISFSKIIYIGRRIKIAKAIARVIIEADGKEFVPETDGEHLDRAVKIGLFPRNTAWSSPLTREEAAILMVKLYDLLKRG